MRPMWGLMAHGWVFEGMGLVSGRKETGLAVWCFVLWFIHFVCGLPFLALIIHFACTPATPTNHRLMVL